MRGLEGRTAFITGAARQRGIGRAIALRLAEEGCDIAVTGLDRDPSTFPEHEQAVGWKGVPSVAEEVQGLGRRAVAVHGDVTVRDDVNRMVEQACEALGGIDILVNNAAIPSGSGDTPILDMDDDLWYQTVDVNLNGLYLVTKRVGQVMCTSGRGGAVVNISATGGRQGAPNHGAYCATKWAVIGLTQQLAAEWARFNVRVNCVCPGSTDTDMMDGTFLRRAAKSRIEPEVARSRLLSAIPMRRQATQEEQAAAVAFLASDEASYITGQSLNVDGGLRMD
jgi:3-oxoacyl-[acyl-carrier protein] reductase/meso-butanediol dehydrogenase/(S,S)-butanediol dehydrogenase/diacetyl reductase